MFDGIIIGVKDSANLAAVLDDQEHRVKVRPCRGYECKNAVTSHKVRQNIHGEREYCSLLCYARWPPAMRETIARYPEYEPSPSGLEALIRDLKAIHGIQGTADILGYSRSTVSYWLRKLVAFRNFAGQSTSTILYWLAETAEHQGMDYAAQLVQVSPKTLERSFDRLPDLQIAA